MGTKDDIEDYMKIDFILTGYRVNYHKPTDILKSLFLKHNETLNVWTHLIGFILFIVLGYILVDKYSSYYQKIYSFEHFLKSLTLSKNTMESILNELSIIIPE